MKFAALITLSAIGIGLWVWLACATLLWLYPTGPQGSTILVAAVLVVPVFLIPAFFSWLLDA